MLLPQLLELRYLGHLPGSFQLVLLAQLSVPRTAKLSLQLGLFMQQEETVIFQDFWRILGKRCMISLETLWNYSNERLTPLMAVVFNAVIGILMVLPESSNIENLLDYFSFAMWTIYALTFISIIIFRYRKPYCDVERKFKVRSHFICR